MHRYGIEDEGWFEASRSGLELRGFKLRILPRSIVIEKEGRLPRLLGSARELLEFAERQGLDIDEAALAEAEGYGDDRSDLSGRFSASPFETPSRTAPAAAAPGRPVYAELRPPEVNNVETRMAELRLEQDKIALERAVAQALVQEKQLLEQRCAALEAELRRALTVAEEAAKQRDLWQMSAASAEDQLRLLRTETPAPPVARGADKRFDQLRRFLARELHPDLAGEDCAERGLREALFKRIWARIEQLQ